MEAITSVRASALAAVAAYWFKLSVFRYAKLKISSSFI
jgi:hypothetical protein